MELGVLNIFDLIIFIVENSIHIFFKLFLQFFTIIELYLIFMVNLVNFTLLIFYIVISFTLFNKICFQTVIFNYLMSILMFINGKQFLRFYFPKINRLLFILNSSINL